jgi:hypothetical protein
MAQCSDRLVSEEGTDYAGAKIPKTSRKEVRREPLRWSLMPAPPCMDSISKEIEGYKTTQVRRVAGELRLPFGLEALRKHAERGVANARQTYDAKSGQESWLQYVRRHIYVALAQGGLEEEARAGERSVPKGEHIREALAAFSEPKIPPKNWEWNWEHLLKGCGYEEVKALGDYLDANKNELERSLGKRALQHIEVCARERRISLKLRNSLPADWVNPMGPQWAEDWRQHSRAKNLQRAPRPTTRRSWMEMVSDRAIAEALSQDGLAEVTPYQVKKWRERMEREPYEEFDGDPAEYRLKILDPTEYEEYKRRKEQDKE